MKILRGRAQRWSGALARARYGTASVEVALTTALVLAPICAGIADIGVLITNWARMNRAEDAALTLAWSNPGGITATLLSNAAAAVWGNGTPALTVSSSTACYCIPQAGTWQGGSSVTCGSSCGSPQVLATYLTVSLSAAVPLVVPLPGFVSPCPISVTGTVRVQ